jgi:hypothetical protein
MTIISQTALAMVGANALGFPLPPLVAGSWGPGPPPQAAYLVVSNIGAADCYVAVGATAAVVANSTSQLVAAGTYATTPGALRSQSALAIGPIVSIPLQPGAPCFLARSRSPSKSQLRTPTARKQQSDLQPSW